MGAYVDRGREPRETRFEELELYGFEDLELYELVVLEPRSAKRKLSETVGEEYHPPLDHPSGPRSNPGGRRQGGECAGGRGAAPTSAKACVGSELVRVRVQRGVRMTRGGPSST